ncbi:putative major facilitator, sugar transporter, major facilitator superfamily [Helianthus annuus]|nr:putative major facilitator, sugar transporter, major facilitator superfamily [Helianthus annuus]KAJ0955846.1 putative major facilitator, sugar transporter, major facilitator superfamily [Helianthus annuus]
MEGGVVKPNKTEFSECFKTIWRTPYIMLLAFSAGIGGLLFGYDTGVISGASLYIRDDFKDVERHTWLQETIVSTAVAGAIVGAAIGGWMNDRFGRKKSILCADFLFCLGSLTMALAPNPWVIIVGRLFVGLGVGLVSMTSPLYISEASPARIRGALVSTNGLLLTGGQFLSYLINLAFSKTRGNWRWMLGIAGVPPLVQFILMCFLPESPRWLYRQNKIIEARDILEKIYPSNEVGEEMKALQSSVETEKEAEGSLGDGIFSKMKSAWGNKVVRRGLYAGVTVQVAQQFVGINTVMYYSPTIVQLAGFASNRTALALSLVTTGLNSFGTMLSMLFVDRFGRRRLMLISMVGIITCLVVLSILFFQASVHAPLVGISESNRFGVNYTCSDFKGSTNPSSWNCMTCLRASSGCGFCASNENIYYPGACLAVDTLTRSTCRAQHRTWYTYGCPSKFGIFTVLLLGLYILCYAPGIGTVPWIVNSEIYPLRYRGTGGGIAAVSNWVSNLVISETFLTLTETLGSSGTFLLFAGFSTVGLVAIFFLVPETKGMHFEEVEKMLEKGYRPRLWCSQDKDMKSAS